MEELAALQSELSEVDLPRRTQLEIPNKKIEHVYFMESGIASVVAVQGARTEVEVGIIGWEGITGLSILHLGRQSPYSVYMQVAGSAQRTSVAVLRQLMERSIESRRLLLCFAQSFLVQTSETAVANARATIEDRLARWLLMAQDRVESDVIPLTHEFLSLMMGARRAGVTEAIHELTHRGMIVAARGKITVLDRKGLEQRAGVYYGVPEKELRRLLAE
ncbi:MAG TPA: Crp/Fnr family transcriptional regulator [Rhizomicrobium sp.]|jgi:CRP-like cAMP-binding protein|nr:Crp/Fnr family transcriptional regulator [Rhizomicrobium sp.]